MLFPPYARKVATVTVTYKGAPVSLQLAGASVQEVEKLLDSLTGRAGWELPTRNDTFCIQKLDCVSDLLGWRLQNWYGKRWYQRHRAGASCAE